MKDAESKINKNTRKTKPFVSDLCYTEGLNLSQ